MPVIFSNFVTAKYSHLYLCLRVVCLEILKRKAQIKYKPYHYTIRVKMYCFCDL